MGTSKNCFGEVNSLQIECRKGKLACLYCRDAAADDEIAQIESRAQASLSMTEMQAMTQSVNTLGIDAFGIRFGASGLDSERVHYLRSSA